MAQRQRKQKMPPKNRNVNSSNRLDRSKRFKRSQKKKTFPENTSSSSPSTDDDSYHNHAYGGRKSNNAFYRNQHVPADNIHNQNIPYSAQLAQRYYGNKQPKTNSSSYRNDENYRHNNSPQRISNNPMHTQQPQTLYNGHYNQRPPNTTINRNRMNNAVRPQSQRKSSTKKPLAVAHNIEHFYNDQHQNHANDNVFRSMLNHNPKRTPPQMPSPKHSASRSKSKSASKSRSRSSKSKKLNRRQNNPKEDNIQQQKRNGHNKYWSGHQLDQKMMQFNNQITIAHAIALHPKPHHYPVANLPQQTQQHIAHDESDSDEEDTDEDDFDDAVSSVSNPVPHNNPSPQAYSHDTYSIRHHSSVLSPPNESVLASQNNMAQVSPPPPPPIDHAVSIPSNPAPHSMYNTGGASWNNPYNAPYRGSMFTQAPYARGNMNMMTPPNDNSYLYNAPRGSFPQCTQPQTSLPPNYLSSGAAPDEEDSDHTDSSDSASSRNEYKNMHRFVTRGQITHRGAIVFDPRLRASRNSAVIGTMPADNRHVPQPNVGNIFRQASSMPPPERSNDSRSSSESTSFTPTAEIAMSVSCGDMPLRPTLSNNASTISVSTSEIARVRSNCKIDRYGFPLKKEKSMDDDVKIDHKNYKLSKKVQKRKKKRTKDKDEQRRAARKEKALLLQWQNILFPSSKSKKSKIHWIDLKKKGSSNQKVRSLMKTGGIPQPFRSFAWSNFCNVNNTKNKNKNKGLYERLLSQNRTKRNSYEDIIWKDIYRTFRANLKYGAVGMSPGKGTEIDEEQLVTESQETLYNVLSAFSIYNKDIGYCQGMQAISALLLMYMVEEDVFFILNTIAREEKYGKLCTCWNMEEIHLRFAQFDYCFKEYLPKLYRHLAKNNITDVSMFGATAWFITIFISSSDIDFDLIVRIWDMYLAKGFKIVFKFGVGYLKYLEKKLLKTTQFELLITTLNNGFKLISENGDNEKYIQMSLNVKIKQKQIEKWAKKYNKRKPH